MKSTLLGSVFLSLGLSFDLAITAPVDTYIRSNNFTDAKIHDKPHFLHDDDQGRTLIDQTNCKGSELNVGERLMSGECICKNDVYFMCMDQNGNLKLLRDVGGERYAFWSAKGDGGDFLEMQQDGDLVIYKTTEDGGKVGTWHTNTFVNGKAALILQNGGTAMVVSEQGSVLWAKYERGCKRSGITTNSKFLNKGETLFRGQYICRSNYSFGMSLEGDLEILHRDETKNKQNLVWRVDLSAEDGLFLKMRGNGDLVVYTTNFLPVWSSDTKGNNNARVRIRDGGKVNIEATNGSNVWAISPSQDPSGSSQISSRTFQGCLANGKEYKEGETVGFISLECADKYSYNGKMRICKADGSIEDIDMKFSCGGSIPYCVQCGSKTRGAPLCLPTETTDRDC